MAQIQAPAVPCNFGLLLSDLSVIYEPKLERAGELLPCLVRRVGRAPTDRRARNICIWRQTTATESIWFKQIVPLCALADRQTVVQTADFPSMEPGRRVILYGYLLYYIVRFNPNLSLMYVLSVRH